MREKILAVQKILEEKQWDGWLLSDFQKRNPLAIEFLEIPSSLHLTRRLFYWIPAAGEPIKILHKIESHILEGMPGEERHYLEYQILERHLQEILRGKKRIAMEYSPQNRIPAISFVDGGVLDLVKPLVQEVVSSGGLVQSFTCVLSQAQKKSHQRAAKVLEDTVDLTWDFLTHGLRKGEKLTEFIVQEFMVQEMEKQGCVSEGRPICAVNANSSNPHYGPDSRKHALIQKGDFVLLDLWCKQKQEGAVYADIARVAVADRAPTRRQEEIFAIVQRAQQAALEFIQRRCLAKEEIKGYEVDQITRHVIEQEGYKEYFLHRTGHNIYTTAHGPGTHLDSLETWDERPLMLGTCFSIEPGIYLPGEFGVRLEYDVTLTPTWEVEVTGGKQQEIKRLL